MFGILKKFAATAAPFVALSIALYAWAGVGAAWAAGANVTQHLDFGRWHVASNADNYAITLQADGSYTNSPQLIMIQPPRPGIYTLTGLALSMPINSVVVTQVQPLRSGGAETFEMDAFDVTYDPTTDAGGTAQVTVGATASTSGSGAGYGTASYSGQLNIQVNY